MAKTSKVNFKNVPGAKWAPSNKQQTPGITPTKDDLAPASGDDAPTPFIDKLSVLWTPSSDEVAKTTYGQLMLDAGQPHSPFKSLSGGSKGGFKWARRIALDSVADTKMWPLLQLDHAEGEVEKLRIEFVPVDLGSTGLAELHSILVGVLDNGWHSFASAGRVSRLDVAVDLPHASMDKLLFLPKHAATIKHWSQGGQLQTYTQGKKSGNQWRIYDRQAKRKAQGKAWQGKTGIRIERSIRFNPSSPLNELPALKNPFHDLSVIKKMPPCPVGEKKTYIWHLFQCAIEERGLAGALALLPEDKRQLYADHFSASSVPWWNPDEIWLNWKHMLDELGLAHPTKWT